MLEKQFAELFGIDFLAVLGFQFGFHVLNGRKTIKGAERFKAVHSEFIKTVYA